MLAVIILPPALKVNAPLPLSLKVWASKLAPMATVKVPVPVPKSKSVINLAVLAAPLTFQRMLLVIVPAVWFIVCTLLAWLKLIFAVDALFFRVPPVWEKLPFRFIVLIPDPVVISKVPLDKSKLPPTFKVAFAPPVAALKFPPLVTKLPPILTLVLAPFINSKDFAPVEVMVKFPFILVSWPLNLASFVIWAGQFHVKWWNAWVKPPGKKLAAPPVV